MQRILAVVLLLACSPRPAAAALEWASWGPPSGNASTGVFTNGQQVTLAADFTGISGGVTAGTEFTSSPSIPGRPDNTNPAFQRLVTGSGTVVSAGTVFAALDLSNIAVTSTTTFGIADHKSATYYLLELRDTSLALLPVTAVVVTAYNLTYANGGLIADLNEVLDTTTAPGRLSVDADHDAGGTYGHTGLTTFSNLPAGTRYIALRAEFDSGPEGISIFLANDLGTGVQVTDSEGSAADHAVAFGNSTIGSLGVQTVTVTNFTASAVTIGITDSLAAPFGIADPGDCTITLLANEDCTITVTYQPTDTTTKNDSLTLDLGGTPQIVTVSGTGGTPTIAVTDSIGDTSDRKLLFANTVPAGGAGSGTLTIKNTDTVPVTVTLTDTLAVPFSFTGTNCDGITLTVNQSCTATIQFAPTTSGIFDDFVTWDAGGTSITVELNGTPGFANADFGVTTSASDPVIQPGVGGSDQTTITITVTNDGPDDGGAIVDYALPPGVTLVTSSPSQGSYDPVTGQWATGVIASGGSVTLHLTIQAGGGAASCLANTAAATAGAGTVDLAGTNNSSTAYVAAPACADLQIGASGVNNIIDGDPLTPIRAIDITHTIDVRNRGPGPATGVKLTLVGYSLSPSDGVTDGPVNGTIIDVGNLAAGETKTVTIAEYSVGNTSAREDVNVIWAVSLTGDEPDPDSSSNADTGGYIVARNGGGGGSCFIATAAYGSYLEPEVMVLRHFRDRYLLTNSAGQAFVAWYYRVSPPLANYIRQREGLRAVARIALTPLVYAIEFPSGAGLLLILVGLLARFLFATCRSSRRYW